MISIIFALTLSFLCSTINGNLLTVQKGLGVPCSNREGWATQTYSANTKNNANDANSKPVPAFDDAAYLEYRSTGNRIKSDINQKSITAPLTELVIVECIDNANVYIKKIEEYLNAIATQRSWSYTAHDTDLSYYNGRYFIDLGAAEKGELIAQIYFMLQHKLSAATKTNILNALENRIFKPMRLSFNNDPWIKNRHYWETSEDNWNTVCWSGIAIAALAGNPNQADRDIFVQNAIKGAQHSWGAFKSDGYFHEGADYFNLALKHMIIMRQAIMEATNGREDYFATNLNAPQYMAYAFEFPMTGNIVGMFGDDKVGYIQDGLRNYIDSTFSRTPKSNYNAAYVDWTFFGFMMGHNLKMNKNYHYPYKTKIDFSVGKRKYFTSSKVLVTRSDTPTGIHATFKLLGGSTAIGMAHNHDDAGTYAIVKNNVKIAGDIGCGHYEGSWNQRYESATGAIYNSFSHPVPIIGGKLQVRNNIYNRNEPKPKAYGEYFSDDVDSISFDLKAAYDHPNLISLTRNNTLNRASQTVVIQDRVTFSSPTTFENVISSRDGYWTQTSISSNFLTGTITNGGGSLNVKVHANNPFTVFSNRTLLSGVTFTRISIKSVNPISNEIFTITYS